MDKTEADKLTGGVGGATSPSEAWRAVSVLGSTASTKKGLRDASLAASSA